MWKFRFEVQRAEWCGSVNKYFCSVAHKTEVTDEETLFRYYVKQRGAEDFARRWEEAMSELNRYYCSEFYGYDVRDPEILWQYYMKHRRDGHGKDKIDYTDC
jgi:hypothetical protein